MEKRSGWSSRRWTKNEDIFLKNNYLKRDYHEIARLLKREYTSIRTRRYFLKLTKKESGSNVQKPTCKVNIKKEDCIYLAGLFDGEGTVSVLDKNNKLTCRWAIGMKEKELLENLQKIWNCGIIYQRKDGLTSWAINTRENLKRFLPQVIPYLRIKKEKSKDLLDFLKNYKRGEIKRLK